MSRYDNWLRWRVAKGTPEATANASRSAGRKLMGELMRQLELSGNLQGKLQRTLSDGTQLTAQFDGTTPIVEISAPPPSVELPVLRCSGLKGNVAGPFEVTGWPLFDATHPEVGLKPYARVASWGVDFATTEQSDAPLQLLTTQSTPTASTQRYGYNPDTRTFSLVNELAVATTPASTIGAYIDGKNTLSGSDVALSYSSSHRWLLTSAMFNYRNADTGTKQFALRASSVAPADPIILQLRQVYRDPNTRSLAQYLLFAQALSAASIRLWLCILQLTPGALSYVSRKPVDITFASNLCENDTDVSAAWYTQRVPFMWAYGFRLFLPNSNGDVITVDFANQKVTAAPFAPIANYKWDFTDTGASTDVCNTGIGLVSHRDTVDGTPMKDGVPVPNQTYTQPYQLVVTRLHDQALLANQSLDIARGIDEKPTDDTPASFWATSVAVCPDRKRALVFVLPVSVADKDDPSNPYAPLQNRARYMKAYVYEIT